MIPRLKFKLGMSSLRRKETVSHYLQITLVRALQCSPIDFGVPWMGGRRTAKEQKLIFDKGHSKCDGTRKLSNHQNLDKDDLCEAVDIVPYIPVIGYSYTSFARFGVIGMLMLEAWQELQQEGLIPKDLFLHWGGFWRCKDPKRMGWDLAHYEIKKYAQVERV